MLSLLVPDGHDLRLRELLERFRSEERELAGLLAEIQAEVECSYHSVSRERLGPGVACRQLLARCAALEADCEAVATELMHVRMAVAGTQEELRLFASRMIDPLCARSTPA